MDMDCVQTSWPTNEEYLRAFNKKVAQRRVPLSGNLALTHRCNLRCVHCYLGKQTSTRENLEKELNTSQWKRLIDEITEAGCLYLLITGGEPLLREDFKEIYRHAKDNGLLVTLFTNGTLITENTLELFNDLPPRMVEVTLYGATSGTYERITGVRGSFEKCMKGIRRLIDHQVNVKLKTILMKLNHHEFVDIENIANEYGIKFRFDASIFPCTDGDRTPIELRIDAEDAVEKEFSDDNRWQAWKDFFVRMRDLPGSDKLYQCGAGLSHFHIDPYGNLQPCLMVTNLKYNIINTNSNNSDNGCFLKGWKEIIPRIRERKLGPGNRCHNCEKRSLCNFCPAFFKLENGAEDRYSEYLCTMGHLRFEKINEVLQNNMRRSQ
jgi:radical SAM protein with 4Fe4S-binding SPASM domain